MDILLIDDNADDRALARRALMQALPGARIAEVATLRDFEARLSEEYDCVITDYRLGWSDGLTLLRRLQDAHPDQPVIMFTDSGSEEVCAEAMKAGLADYRVKRRAEFARLPLAVRDAVSLAAARSQSLQSARHVAELLERERHARNEAVRASHLKDEFLATVSHELRTPLSAILGWAHLLQMGRLTRQQEKEAFAVIERSARAQAKLIDDILDVSRIVSGTLRVDLGPIDLLSSLRSALDAARPLAAAKTISLTSVLDPAPPPVRGDAPRLEQVVLNLLTNAIKFTPQGGLVQLGLDRHGSSVRISVQDNGEGIAAGMLPHVFDRFWQGESGPTRRHGGLGIGLSVVKSLVEIHGGTVAATSAGPGQGASFTVLLPVAVMREQDVAGFERRAEAQARHHELRGIRVLAVDDDPDTAAIMSRVLSAYGAQVDTARNADEALALLTAADRFDVLLSDIGMPGQDGYGLIARVRELPRPQGDIPAASVTAFARGRDRERALMAGFDAHLTKPVEPGELIAVVLALLKRRDRA
nr:response regulator [Noviherbaspirillum pedocola]